MGWPRWKAAEAQVARITGGTRRIRVQYSESVEDVHHTKYAVEVKYGLQIPKWISQVKYPSVVWRSEDYPRAGLLIFPSSLWSSYEFSSMSLAAVSKKIKKPIGFLLKGLEQARSYNPNKIPILALKPPRLRGVVFVTFYCEISPS